MKRLDFFLLPFFMDMAVAMSQLMVNLRALDLGASALMVGVLLGVGWGIPYVLVSMACGKIVAKYGARVTMTLGAALFGLSVAGYGGASSTVVLLAAAPLGGIGSALFWPALQTCLPGDNEEETRARSGVFNVSWTLGILLGGATAGHLYRYAGPHWSFWLVAAVIGVVAVLVAVRARSSAAPVPGDLEATPDAVDPRIGRAYLLMARVSNLAMWFIGAAAGAVFPRLARGLGFDDGSIGEIAAAVWVGQVAAFAWFSRGAWWHYRLLPLAAGLCGGMAAMGLLAWGVGAAALVGGFALIGVARAPTHVASMHYGLHVGTSPEANMGYHEAILGVGFVLGPLLGGLAADAFGLHAPFALSACLAAAALCIVLAVGKRAHRG